MSTLLPLIVAGIVAGSAYGLAGVGLVLTYKTSGIFNFAQGALGTVAAYAFYFLYVQHGVAWPWAAAVSVLVVGPLLGVLFETFARGISQTALVWRVASTVGVMVSIEALFTIIYGTQDRTFPHFLSQSTFSVFGTNVTYEQLIGVLLSAGLTAGLFVFFRVGRMGKAMRAVVDDPALLALSGISAVTVRRLAWIVGATFAALSGLLLAPNIPLNASNLTLLIAQAFGAAAIGGFVNLPLTWLGGLAIGIASSVLTAHVSATSILGGLPASLPFIVLFLVLLVFPKSRALKSEVVLFHRRPPWQAPKRVQLVLAALVLAVLLVVPQFAGLHLTQWTGALASVMLLLSLGLLARTSGQVSLCQASFAAIGVVGFAHLHNDGVPWIPALILGGLIAVPIGALVAIPAIRLSGLYLALATLGFGIMLQDMFYNSSLMFGISTQGLYMPMPHLNWLKVDSDKGFYYVVLVILVITAIAVAAITRSRLGRLLKALSDSPNALTMAGTNVTVTRVLVFCISAFIAGIAGALSGMSVSYTAGSNFDPFTSLTLFVLIMILVGRDPWYALLGGLGIGLFPAYVTSPNVGNYLALGFGVSAITAGLGMQGEMPARIRAFLERVGHDRPAGVSVASEMSLASKVRDQVAPMRLRVQDLSVQFGGLIAVSDLSLDAATGRIAGLIGPNGAGKTTTFNACSGLVRPTSGRIFINDDDVTRLGRSARARRGLGRTFQTPDLFMSLTVAENVALGREASLAGAGVVSQLIPKPGQRPLIDESTAGALTTCRIEQLAHIQVNSLSTGQRRLVELARCLAGPFSILLLDEPSAGLDRSETGRFGQVLRSVVETRGIGVLLIEHDMTLVMEVCDDITVLDFGTMICRGTPTEVRASNEVRAAYLGASPGTDLIEEHSDPLATSTVASVPAPPFRPDVRSKEPLGRVNDE
jgi:ABC-type branched-subunit amino acid transport system ATPase component/branched-subunit amino acid ABC-type transport system permease component